MGAGCRKRPKGAQPTDGGVTKKFTRKIYMGLLGLFSRLFQSTKMNAKEYCDVSLQKVNDLINEFKREKEKYFGQRYSLKPGQEKELELVK